MSNSYDIADLARVALKGKTVMITGATGGIGFSTARLMYRAGCNLIVTGSNQEKMNRLLADLVDGEGKVWSYICDLTKPKEIAHMIERSVSECSPIDILINNAGFALKATKPFWEQDLDDVDTVMDVNVRGLMHITHGVLRYHMMKRSPQPTGTVLFVSSITGHQAPLKDFNEASYHTSKAAVEGFANVLRHETSGTNIRILVHRPGTTLTEFHSRRLEYDSSSVDDMFSGMCALQADDLAEGIVWQCLQPERVSVVTMETLPTSQRSLYQVDKNWEERNRV